MRHPGVPPKMKNGAPRDELKNGRGRGSKTLVFNGKEGENICAPKSLGDLFAQHWCIDLGFLYKHSVLTSLGFL